MCECCSQRGPPLSGVWGSASDSTTKQEASHRSCRSIAYGCMAVCVFLDSTWLSQGLPLHADSTCAEATMQEFAYGGDGDGGGYKRTVLALSLASGDSRSLSLKRECERSFLHRILFDGSMLLSSR